MTFFILKYVFIALFLAYFTQVFYRMRKMASKLLEQILRWADLYMRDISWKGKLSGIILSKSLRDRQSFIFKMPVLVGSSSIEAMKR